MTTNAGTQSIMKAYSQDQENVPETAEQLNERVQPELLRTFKPAFLGRIKVIPYIPLDAEVIRDITKLQLEKVKQRINKHYQADFAYTDAVLDTIVARCQEVETGARNVEHLISGNLLPALSAEFLGHMAKDESINKVIVDIDDKGDFSYQIQ